MVAYLQHHFEVTSGPADVYVGMRITRERPTRQLWIDQSRYTLNILEKYGFMTAHPVSTPFDSYVILQRDVSSTDKLLPDFPYQEAVGSLLYLSTITRPDISYATSTVAQYCSNSRELHVTALKRIFKYLRDSFNMGICYTGSRDPNILFAYVDSDYARDVDDRKSRSGCCLILNDGPVSWFSRKQLCVATSTTESEYVAASLASGEVQWLRRLLNDIAFPQQPTRLFSDNQAAIRLVLNPEFHQRTKHIDVAYHKIRHLQETGDIVVSYIDTHHQLADILTKALTFEKFSLLRTSLSIIKTPQV